MAASAMSDASRERHLLEDADRFVTDVEAAAAEEVASLAADQPSATSRPGASLRMNWPAALMTFELKLPQSPRSAVITMSSGLPVPCGRNAQQRMRILIDARHEPVEHLSIRCANGRAAMTRSCARLGARPRSSSSPS